MKCDCGSKTKCIDSRDTGNQYRRRRYQCCSCKKRFSTLEIKFSYGNLCLEKDLRELAFYEKYMARKKAVIDIVKKLKENNIKGF